MSIDPGDMRGLQALVRECPGLTAGHILTPVEAKDPYYDNAAGSPSLILQLEFDDIALLEGHLRINGYLACLAAATFLPGLRGTDATQQAMLTRRYPVPEERSYATDESVLSYWVEYAGPAEDESAWHNAYVRHHPHLLARLPGIRSIEIYTPVVAICELRLPVRGCLQRNKTVFDSPEAMTAAMLTPARDALREDFRKLPPFEGAALHFPFMTRSYRPTEQRCL